MSRTDKMLFCWNVFQKVSFLSALVVLLAMLGMAMAKADWYWDNGMQCKNKTSADGKTEKDCWDPEPSGANAKKLGFEPDVKEATTAKP